MLNATKIRKVIPLADSTLFCPICEPYCLLSCKSTYKITDKEPSFHYNQVKRMIQSVKNRQSSIIKIPQLTFIIIVIYRQLALIHKATPALTQGFNKTFLSVLFDSLRKLP